MQDPKKRFHSAPKNLFGLRLWEQYEEMQLYERR